MKIQIINERIKNQRTDPQDACKVEKIKQT